MDSELLVQEEYYLILFYTIKRIFLFADEWLGYFLALAMLIKGHYKTAVLIFFCSFICLHVSYYNLDLIEKEIINVNQMISPFDRPINYVMNGIDFSRFF